MSKLAGMLGVIGTLCLGIAVTGQEKAPPDRATTLIHQLGSKRFAEREQATRALDALGPVALDALRKATRHKSLEVRRRAQTLLRKIERRVAAARLLAPARVRLVYKDTPIAEAVADLMKRTGLKLVLDGDTAALARRKLTLDTGNVPLWEAFDLFCRKAELDEVDTAVSARPGAQRGGVSVTIVGGRRRVVAREPVDVLGKATNDEPVTLHLRDGTRHRLPTHLAGAVRIRALSPGVSAAARNPGEMLVHLDVTTEPSLLCQDIIAVKVTRALDDQGQKLRGRLAPSRTDSGIAPPRGTVVINGRVITAPEERPTGPSRLAPLQFDPGPKSTRSLKELSGALLVRVESAPENLVTIADVLKSAGKKFTGPQGSWIHVHEARRDENNVTLRIEVAPPPHGLSDGTGANEPILNVIINGRRLGEPEAWLGSTHFTLFDARGRPLQATRAVYTGKHTATAQEYELTYTAGEGTSFRLVYRDRRSALLDVPFTLKDVPLQ